MRKITASLVMLIALAACGGGAQDKEPAAMETSAVTAAPVVDQTPAAPVTAPVAPKAVTVTTPAARVAVTTTTARPAVTTTTAAPVIQGEATTTTTALVAATTTTTMATTTVPTCSVAVASPVAAEGSEQTVTLTSDAPGRRFRLQVSYPQFGTGKPNPRQTFEITTDGAGSWAQTFKVIATSTVPANVWATPYGDQGQLLTDSSCYATFDAVAA